jgi:hypothetical protein
MDCQAEDTQKAAVRPEDPAEIALKRPDAIMHFEQDGRGLRGTRRLQRRPSLVRQGVMVMLGDESMAAFDQRSTGPSAPARRCIPVMGELPVSAGGRSRVARSRTASSRASRANPAK